MMVSRIWLRDVWVSGCTTATRTVSASAPHVAHSSMAKARMKRAVRVKLRLNMVVTSLNLLISQAHGDLSRKAGVLFKYRGGGSKCAFFRFG